MSDDPTVRHPIPDPDAGAGEPDPGPESSEPGAPEPATEPPQPGPSAPVPPSRIAGRAGQFTLGTITFVAALLLLLGTTRFLERGGVAGAPTARPSSSAIAASSPSSTIARGSSHSAGPTPTLAPGQTPTPTPADPVLVGAGDIGDCATNGDEATAALLDGIEGTVFTAGDDAYPSGTKHDFRKCYDPTWGRFKARTRPVPGNHDWETRGLAGYVGYYGAAAQGPGGTSWYSFDVGAWHVIMLDSMCDHVGGCDPASPQGTWLASDLAAHDNACTMAIFHFPRFSSGEHGNDASMDVFWQPLYASGVDVIVNGHDNDYERFAPQDSNGTADDARGIREFVVGTGGTALRGFKGTVANSHERVSTVYGVIAFTLHADSYDWQFIAADNPFRDSGTGKCH